MALRTDSVVGEFRWNVTADTWLWSPEMFGLHGYPPQALTPTTELVLEHKAPEAQTIAEKIMARSQTADQTFRNYHRIVDAAGHTRTVLTVGRSSQTRRGRGGPPVRTVVGFMADLTDEEKAAKTAAVIAARESQAALQHTIGALMALGGTSEDVVLAAIKRSCSDRNVKLAAFGDRFVEISRQGRLAGGPASESLERLRDEADEDDEVLAAVLRVLTGFELL